MRLVQYDGEYPRRTGFARRLEPHTRTHPAQFFERVDRDTVRAMSNSLVDAFARFFPESQRAFNNGDFEEALAGLAPDVEWHLLPGLPETGVIRGRDSVIRFFSETRDALNWEVHAREFLPAGPGRVFVHQRGHFLGRATKIAGTLDFFQIWEVDETGTTVRVREYTDRAETLKAAGLSE